MKPIPETAEKCNCITEVNSRLQEDGRELDLLTDPKSLQPVIPIGTRWIDGGKRAKKPGRIAASNCPFCGVKL